jgi:peptide/nickel transport system substrate-binding protein
MTLHKITRTMLASFGVAATVLFAAACGSSTGGSSSSAPPSAVPTAGPGLTSPYTPSGTRVAGGTVYFTEGSQAPPNFIFPMYDFAFCSTVNIDTLIDLLYRPLYWYGDKYRPTVDYNRSIGEKPIFSNGDKTVTVHLNPYKWSDGESVTSRDVLFWMNLVKASPATNWCGYAPGYFPGNITSYSAPNASTFVLNFDKAYDPEWVLYNELSQITPMPLAWDRTSLSQPAPTSDTGNLPDAQGKAKAEAVYNFLVDQGKSSGTWASSPLWSVVDGPFKLQSFSSSGEVVLVPNPAYSGTPKPSISKFVELPFTSEDAIYNTIRSGGPSAVTIGTIPPQYAPQIPTLEGEGYQDNKAGYYGFNYFPLNFNTSASTSTGQPLKFIFRQTYFREALQHLIDQAGWIKAYLDDTASPTCGPIPITPPDPLVNTSSISFAGCTYSIAQAKQLLSSHGWKVVPGGNSTCQNPTLCGAGISKGEEISFSIDYLSGVVSAEDEMNQVEANAKKLGVNISLTTHPFATVIAAAVPCNGPSCKWEAENWGAGWIYGPQYLPTGEPLYLPGSAANAGSYVDSTGKMSHLIAGTITGPVANESSAVATYANYVSQQVPVVFGPTSLGTYGAGAGVVVDKRLGGYAANALGFLTPEDYYFVR